MQHTNHIASFPGSSLTPTKNRKGGGEGRTSERGYQSYVLLNCTYCCYCLEVKFGCKSSSHNWTYKPTEQNEETNTISILSWLLVQLAITASFPGLFYFCSSVWDKYYTGRKPKSNKQGRTGNEASLSVYQIALSWQCCTAVSTNKCGYPIFMVAV